MEEYHRGTGRLPRGSTDFSSVFLAGPSFKSAVRYTDFETLDRNHGYGWCGSGTSLFCPSFQGDINLFIWKQFPPFFSRGFSLFFLWRLQDFLFLDLPLWGLAGIKPPLAYTKVIASGCSSAFSFRYGYVRLVILPCSSSDRALTLWLQHHFPFLSSKGGGGGGQLISLLLLGQ